MLGRLKEEFYLNFIKEDRWRFLTKGIGTTLIITLSALVIGILIGIVVASVRSTYDKNKEEYELRGGISVRIMKILQKILKKK